MTDDSDYFLSVAERKARIRAAFKANRSIEAGFISQLLACAPADIDEGQVDALRTAFFCGAKHLLLVMDAMAEVTRDKRNSPHVMKAGQAAVNHIRDELTAFMAAEIERARGDNSGETVQ